MAGSQPPGGEGFKELERRGWGSRADQYDAYAGRVTVGAAERMLDAAAVRSGATVLDVACGPGYLAGAAARRGATAIGIDFAAAMVAEARRMFPQVEFREGDAENLAFEAETFDFVLCGFGVLHLESPDRAIAEAARVLKQGGRYAFSAWSGTDRHEYFALVTEAVTAHGTLDVELPPAPPMFRFSDSEECRRSMKRAGLVDVRIGEVPLVQRAPSARAILEQLQKCSVRMSFVLDRQTPEARERIYDAVLAGAERFRRGDSYELAWPALIASAQKP